MRAAGAERAKVLVIALENMQEALQVAEMVRRRFPHLRVVARARNRRHVHLLMAAGVELLVRETFFSALRLTELVMEQIGVPVAQAQRVIELFRAHDERILTESYAVAHDERAIIQTVQDAGKELRDLFEADQSE